MHGMKENIISRLTIIRMLTNYLKIYAKDLGMIHHKVYTIPFLGYVLLIFYRPDKYPISSNAISFVKNSILNHSRRTHTTTNQRSGWIFAIL